LEQVISNSPFSFYREDTSYDQDFTALHDKIEKWFIKKTTAFMDGFLESPAGVAYLEMYEAIRCVFFILLPEIILTILGPRRQSLGNVEPEA